MTRSTALFAVLTAFTLPSLSCTANPQSDSRKLEAVQYAYTDAAVVLRQPDGALGPMSGVHRVVVGSDTLTSATLRITSERTIDTGDIIESCGATFISNHYALTAGHCVDYEWDRYGILGAEVVDTTGLTSQDVLASSMVSGNNIATFQYANTSAQANLRSHATFFTCSVVYFCLPTNRQGCPDNNCRQQLCPAPVLDALYSLTPWTSGTFPAGSWWSDVALLYCSPPTGSSTWLNAQEPSGGINGQQIQRRWFHEVVNLPYTNNDAGTRWSQYGGYLAQTGDWHYSGRAADGSVIGMFHDVWPIVTASATYSGTDWNFTSYYVPRNLNIDTGHRIQMYSEFYTDAPFCHGTSGSGVLTTGTSPYLIGVARATNPMGVPAGAPPSIPVNSASEAYLCPGVEYLRPPANGIIQHNFTAVHARILQAFAGMGIVTADR